MTNNSINEFIPPRMPQHAINDDRLTPTENLITLEIIMFKFAPQVSTDEIITFLMHRYKHHRATIIKILRRLKDLECISTPDIIRMKDIFVQSDDTNKRVL